MAAVIAAVLTLLAAPATEAIAVAPAESLSTYAYDCHHHPALVTGVIAKRGPPAVHHLPITHDVVDWSRGASARPDTVTTPVAYTYDHLASPVHVDNPTATTSGHAEAIHDGLSPFQRAGVAAKGAEDTVSLFKASQRGLGDSHYANGYKPEDFPGNGAYFAREKEIADSYATHYGEGVIETRVPRSVYDEHYAHFEIKYLGSPPGTELAVPPNMLEMLSQFERVWHR